MSLLLAVVFAAATSAPGPANEDLGMLDSWADFTASCGDMYANAEKYARITAKASKEDQMTANLIAYTCESFVRGVSEAVMMADSYIVDGHKLCVDPALTQRELVAEAVKIADEFKNDAQAPQVSSALLVGALGRLSTCR